jgi:glycosyltransferase involved in cell wall biosynthesis
MTKVSIVIATYKRKTLLAESLDSVIAQSEPSFEVIVIDDASRDGTEELLREYAAKDQRIRFDVLDVNGGATAARNKGIGMALGEWIMVWDSDDVLDPDALETLLETASQQPEYSIISAPARVLRMKKLVATRSFPTGEVAYEDVLCKNLPYNVKLRMARREAWEGVRYVSKNVDFLVNIWLHRNGRWYHLDRELGTVRMEYDAVSLTTARKTPNLALSIERSELIATYLEEEEEKLLAACPSWYAAFAYGAAIGLIASKSAKRARRLLGTAIAHVPLKVRSVVLSLLYVLTFLPFSAALMRAAFFIKKHFQA